MLMRLAEFNISVPGAGSQAIDLSKYGNQALGCYLEVAEAAEGLPGLDSPNFRINDLRSDPPTTWRLPYASTMSSASATSSTSATGSQPTSTAPSTASASPTSSSNVIIPMAQSTASSLASAQKTSGSSGLSTGTLVGITLGVVMIVVTLLATVWYVWRSHRTSDAKQLEDLAAAKAAELEKLPCSIGNRQLAGEK